MSLPASTRRRWKLEQGGELGYVDIGDAVVLVPGGMRRLRRKLLDTLSDSEWQEARTGFGDDDLATE